MNDFEEAIKEIIVEQRAKIKELEDENKTLNILLKEYRTALSKYEPPGLLMNAVGRKLLFDLVEKDTLKEGGYMLKGKYLKDVQKRLKKKEANKC